MGLSVRGINRLLAPLKRRVQLLVTRSVVRLVDPAAMLQQLQVEALANEVLDQVEHWEPYGYTSRPHPGAEALLLSLGGRRGHTVAVNVADRRFRLKNLKPGEVALYDDLGNVIVFERDQVRVEAVQHIDVTAPTCHITATTTHDGNVTINGNVVVDGNITASGDITDGVGSMQGMRDTYNGHNHPGDSGGTTGSPNQGM